MQLESRKASALARRRVETKHFSQKPSTLLFRTVLMIYWLPVRNRDPLEPTSSHGFSSTCKKASRMNWFELPLDGRPSVLCFFFGGYLIYVEPFGSRFEWFSVRSGPVWSNGLGFVCKFGADMWLFLVD